MLLLTIMPELLLFSVRKATTHTAPLTLLIKSNFCWFQTFISHNYFLLQTILTQCLISKFVKGVLSELFQVQTMQRLAKKFNLELPSIVVYGMNRQQIKVWCIFCLSYVFCRSGDEQAKAQTVLLHVSSFCVLCTM